MRLGRQDDLVTPAVLLERLADDALALARVLHVGGVDEVDAAVDRGVDDADRILFGCRAAEIHGSETNRRNLDSGAA